MQSPSKVYPSKRVTFELIVDRFGQDLTIAVFTTRYVVNHHSLIVYVTHDTDGSWQFFGAENNIQDDDVRVVLLSEILDLDPTILLLENMDEGFEAVRNGKGDEWQISPIN